MPRPEVPYHMSFERKPTFIKCGVCVTRFRFVNQSTFNVYANVKFATYTFSNTLGEDSSDFDVPFIFGLGSDIKIGKNGFITLAYNELFAIFIDNGGNFPIDFAVGYKMKL